MTGAVGARTAPGSATEQLTPHQLTARAATSLARAAHACELAATAEASSALVTATTAAWARARADHEAVGRLRDRHAARERAERAAAEQRELDDRVAAGWARGAAGATPRRSQPGASEQRS